MSDCLGGEDELEYNCPCGPEGAVQLVNGSSKSEGRLEYCYNTRWTTVCRSYWDTKDAAVVCRQLGYSTIGNFRLYCCCCFVVFAL